MMKRYLFILISILTFAAGFGGYRISLRIVSSPVSQVVWEQNPGAGPQMSSSDGRSRLEYAFEANSLFSAPPAQNIQGARHSSQAQPERGGAQTAFSNRMQDHFPGHHGRSRLSGNIALHTIACRTSDYYVYALRHIII